MRRGAELLREQNVSDQRRAHQDCACRGRSPAGDVDRALAVLDEALATSERIGYRAFEAELHRTRGEILLKRDPTNPAPAEEAFQTAIAVAKQQGTRSFELRAALALAKLCQSTGRPADAQAVLAPALEGFPALSPLLPGLDPGIGRDPAPSAARGAGDEGLAGRDEGSVALTPDLPRSARDRLSPDPRVKPGEERGTAAAEMPEIVEAQALLTALADNEEVKADAVRRQRLTQLHTAYGNALIAARGFGAPETTEAFARARKSASGDKDAAERLAAIYGLWVGSDTRGELPSMRAHAVAFLSEVAARPDSPEAGVAHRAAGITCWFAGEYREARDHLERALALFQPGRDDDLAFRFGVDPGVAAMVYLAIASWPLGDVRRAISLVDNAQERSASVTYIGTHAYAKMHAALFELMRGDHSRAATNAFELARLRASTI